MDELKTLNDAEKQALVSALKACKTAIAAAQALGISRPTLYRRMKKHQINRGELNVG
jgi:transcriptional regulator of acetoin/glycerol metabolism